MSRIARVPDGTIQELDLLIRDGQFSHASRKLEELTSRRCDRHSLADLAWLGWRAGMPLLGLQLLRKYVRPAPGLVADASPRERAEYAACLVRVGAYEEAQELLADGVTQGSHLAKLYTAYSFTAVWDYAKAIPLLKDFIGDQATTSYQSLVGRVNLAACLVFLRRFLPAKRLLTELVYDVSLQRYRLLHGNAFELLAELLLVEGDERGAEDVIAKAERIFGREVSVYSLPVSLWRAVLYLRRDPSAAEARSLLANVRSLALRKGHPQLVRECDYHRAILLKSPDDYLKVWVGTPHPSLRKRLEEEWTGPKVAIPKLFLWSETQTPKHVLNALEGQWERGIAEPLKTGQLPHRLLLILTSDFYRPFRTGYLYSALFPGEHFNPEASPFRLHQSIRRLRRWLKKRNSTLNLELYRDGQYRLSFSSDVGLRIHSGPPAPGRERVAIARLEHHWPKDYFTAKDAASFLGLSERSARRVLGNAVKQGELVREGTRRGARYRAR